jgi:Common central domain of tyrosinase
MAIGDGIRRNVANISQAERDRLIYAFLALDTSKIYPDGVTYWDKQEEIHKNAHAAGQDVHAGPAFVPWHRELCNRLEGLLREVDPALSLHYWDWTTDPRPTLFTPQFMGSATGDAGFPLQNFESTEGGGHTHIWRNVNGGAPGAPGLASDNTVVTAGDAGPQAAQYQAFLQAVQGAHNTAHGYIGGSIGIQHFSFHDPFVFLIHSNQDRLWSQWQLAPGRAWRLDPNQVYGNDGTAPSIIANLEPWSGGSGLRPWAPPDNQQVVKTPKHPSVIAPPLYDTNVFQQSNWRWCHKCEGLYFAGNPGSHCPAGGAHDQTGSGNYSLVANAPPAHGQSNWRWCHKCQGMYFGGNPGSHCPAGGAHDQAGSGNYTVTENIPAGPEQSNWRWCHKCQGLYFAGNPGSHCPVGGAHDQTGSGNYSLVENTSGVGQNNWRWCHKCQGLYFAGNPGSHCPAGGAHDQTGSGNYSLVNSIPSAPGQHNWRWCHKCQGLYFAGNPGSHCPAGGAHDQTGSGNYSLLNNLPAAPDQHNWRWCHKCQGIYFGGHATQGNCPAGGAHDHTGSGDYSLLHA